MTQRDQNLDAERGADPAEGERASTSVRFPVFLAAQAILLTAAVAVGAVRLNQLESRKILPEPRKTPIVVPPTYNYPWIVSDEQLNLVLTKLQPRLRGEKPKINHVDHALRFWGVDAKFNDPQCLSGEEMRKLLTDHRVFARQWGGETDPLLRKTKTGVRVRVQEGRASSSHVDHTLAGLAEVGTPSDFRLIVGRERATMRDMLHHAMARFGINQTEYEWSALAFTLYLAPTKGWVTNEGQRVTFDRLAERIIRQPYRKGVCLGNHRLHALVMMLRVDDDQHILQPETRELITAHLREATARLVKNQHEEGYWDRGWSGEPLEPASQRVDERSSRILATGHPLEWWALAPPEVHPPRETLVRAGQWLSRTIGELDEPAIREGYTFLTHAGRALALWRGKFPVEFLPPVEEKPALKTATGKEQSKGGALGPPDLSAPRPSESDDKNEPFGEPDLSAPRPAPQNEKPHNEGPRNNKPQTAKPADRESPVEKTQKENEIPPANQR